MAARIIVELSDGRVVLLGGAPQPGEPDVGLSGGYTRASADELSGGLSAVGEVVKTIQGAIDALPKRPRKIEIEFGATLSQECDLWIVAADASPEFKIRLAWGDD